MHSESVSARLAARIVQQREYTPQTLALAKRHFVETIGVALSGANERCTRAVLDTAPGGPFARSLMSPRALGLRDAASCNATATHAHDFDDDEPHIIVGHPSVVVVAALMAVADEHPITLSSALRAYVAGSETMTRIGALVNPAHYNRGWHCTATLGVFGAAVATALAMGLDELKIRRALDIAATFANGLKENFGSDMKPIQVGVAASSGVWAAQLAATGMTVSTSALDGRYGFIQREGSTANADASINAYGNPWCVDSPGFNVKIYPCCSSTHTALDGLLSALAETRWTAGAIENIDVWMGPDVADILVHDVPATGLQGKFSMRYCLARAAVSGAPRLEDFTDAAIRDEQVTAMIQRVRVHLDPSLPREPTGVTHQTRVRVTSRSGEQCERVVPLPRGSAAARCTEEELEQKFIACASFSFGPDAATRIWSRINALRGDDRVSLIIEAVHQEQGR